MIKYLTALLVSCVAAVAAPPPFEGPVSVLASNQAGTMVAPSNFFHVNITAGSNILIVPSGPNLRGITIHGTVVGGGTIASNANQFLGVPLSIKDGALVTNLVDYSSLSLVYLPSNTLPVIGSMFGVTNQARHFFYDTNVSHILSNLVGQALSGDVVELGAGVFNVGQQSIRVPVGVTLKGQGMSETTISGAVSLDTNYIVQIMSSNIVEDLTVSAGNRAAYLQTPMGANPSFFFSGITHPPPTNAMIRRVKLDGESDAMEVFGGSTSGTIEDCFFVSKWDVLRIEDSSKAGPLTNDWIIRRTRIVSDPSGASEANTIANNKATPIRLGATKATFVDCEVIATNGGSSYCLIADNAITNLITVAGGLWKAAGTNDAAVFDNYNHAAFDGPGVTPILVSGLSVERSTPGSIVTWQSYQASTVQASKLWLYGTNFGGASNGTFFSHISTIWQPTNHFKFSVTNPVAGQILKFSSVSYSGGEASIVVTNDVDLTSAGASGFAALEVMTNTIRSGLQTNINFVTNANVLVFATNNASGNRIDVQFDVRGNLADWATYSTNVWNSRQGGSALLTNLANNPYTGYTNGITTNANQFGPSVQLTIKDGALITNENSFGNLNITNVPGTTAKVRWWHTNGLAYDEISTRDQWLPTNSFVLSISNAVAGQVLKFSAVSYSGGVATIIVTNDTDIDTTVLTTNANQFGASVQLTLKDGLIVTNLNNVGNLNVTNPPGSTAKLRLWHTNGLAYDELSTRDQWLPTNSFVLSVSNAVAGQVLKFSSVSYAGGIASIVLTNDTDIDTTSVTTNANQFGASAQLTLKDGVITTNLVNIGTLHATNPPGAVPRVRLWHTNATAYDELTVRDQWLPTNSYVFSVTNPVAGQVLKISSVSFASGVASIILTNDADIDTTQITTNANQFGASAQLTLKDGLIVTNLVNVGILHSTNPPGATPKIRLWHTNGQAYDEFTVRDQWLPTNSYVFSVTNPVAGQVLKISSVSIAGGVASIVLTNDTDLTGGAGSSLVTNANQFGASVTLTIKESAYLTNFTEWSTGKVASLLVTNQILYSGAEVYNGSNGTSAINLTNNWDMLLATYKKVTNVIGTNITYNLSNVTDGASIISEFRGNGSYSNKIKFLAPGEVTIRWKNFPTNGSYDILVRSGFNYTVQMYAMSFADATNVNAWISTDDPEIPITAINLYAVNAGISNLVVTNISSVNASLSNVVATNLTVDTGIGYVVDIITGVGGANTNFTGQATDGVIYIDGGTTNVNFVAIMPGASGVQYFPTYILTNYTANNRQVSFSSTTNRWVDLQQYDGVSDPFTLTNKHTGWLSVSLLGTNTYWAFKQATNGF